ncbi:MAG: hypothetical protein AB7F35_00595 [Acetobacteraceae bacterium]
MAKAKITVQYEDGQTLIFDADDVAFDIHRAEVADQDGAEIVSHVTKQTLTAVRYHG